mgnify:CR=1 FL=1
MDGRPGQIPIAPDQPVTSKQVTETFRDGTNGYRKWPDGWIEQGVTNNTGTSGNVTLTFLKPCPSIRGVMAFGLEGSPTTGWWTSDAWSITTLYVAGPVTGYLPGFDWYACGYRAIKLIRKNTVNGTGIPDS